jgi:hypothetical protein
MMYEQHVKAATGALAQVSGQAEDDKAQLHASAIADQILAQQLAPVMQMLQQAQQAMQQFQPPPPPDPQSQATIQLGEAQIASNEKVAMAALQQKTVDKDKELSADGQQKMLELQADHQEQSDKTMADAHASMLAARAEADQTAAQQQTELAKNEQDNKMMFVIEKMQADREAERVRYEQQQETLRTILELLSKSSTQTQVLGDGYERQQIDIAAQADGNGPENEIGREGDAGESADNG